MVKRALIVWGGWDGHEPAKVAARFERELAEMGFAVEVRDTLAAFDDAAALAELSLIVPHWTMGELSESREQNVLAGVERGVGLAGCHGGMGDAFRNSPGWQFMTGGQFVSHPGNDVEYVVSIGPERGAINDGLRDFTVRSEQYYLQVDPAVKVWATTRFPLAPGPHAANGPVDVPQVWTKLWGTGRVFYNALGHNDAVFDVPEAMELMRRGFRWAGNADF